MEIALCAAEKLAEYAIDPILNQFKYLFCYTSNIQNLRDNLENLENKRTGVQLLVDAANRNAEVIGPDVLAWLQKVDNIKKETDDVLKGTTNSQTRCLCHRCPNLKSRYSQSRKATKNTIAIDGLQKEGKFERIGYPRPPVQTLYQMPRDVHGFETRISTKKKILEALKDEDISIIGICGMPGVGKTTLANEIAAEVKIENLFDDVAMADVSKDQDLIKIQDQLAQLLDLKIEEKTNTIVRAGRLRQRLGGDDGKSILVILDDVWEDIDLETIGIPSPSGHKGLKFLYTSRFENVYSDERQKLHTRKFEVKVLSKEEAWQLFKDAAGISHDATDVKSIAEQVAEECGGLPLALVTVGRALKNGNEHKWRSALQQLRKSRVTNIKGMHNLVYSRIEFSYNYLESDDAKSLLLLCSLFPEDQNISIECLVRYARGLEMFQNTDTLSETRDMVISLADDLKSCYLLRSGHEEGVKLHDVVRDVCLSIASKDKHVYMVKHSGLKEWPEGYTYESYTAISLTFDFLQRLPNGLKCAKLKLLRVLCQPHWVDIPQDFFENMQELKVLDLNSLSMEITSFKASTSLQTLCLDYCTLNNDLSMVGRLKKLEILSFYRSSLYDFPSEISELSNLKSLDLRFEEGPCPLPPGFLLGLKKLEELYLGYLYLEIGDDELEHNYIAAISSLSGLCTFQICTNNPKFLLQTLRNLRLEKLQRFQIVRSYEENIENYYFKRSLHLYDIDVSMLSIPAITSLMRRTDDLLLEVKAWNNPVSELDEDGFISLEKLTLQSCEFEYLIDATDFTPARAFSRLQEVCLHELSKMKNLWRGLIKPPSLCNLRVLKMNRCSQIRNLFPESVVKCLVNLKSVEISQCIKLEEIVSRDTVENEITEMIEFPDLNHLNLQSLKSFKQFRSVSTAVSTVPETLFNQVLLPNMEVLEVVHLNCLVKMLGENMQIRSLYKLRVMIVRYCKNMLTIAQSDSIKLLQNLRSLKVVKCAALKVLFDFEGLTFEDHAEGILGKLNSLNLNDLPKLEYILTKVPKGIHVFQDLRSLVVIVCGSLRYLCSPSVANLLVGLEILRVEHCSSMEEIIGREEERETEMVEGTASKIVFPKLSQLHLRYLTSFRMFCSQDYNLVFPSLNKLFIEACPAMTKFCSGQLSAQKLKKVELGKNKFVDISDIQVSGLQVTDVQQTHST